MARSIQEYVDELYGKGQGTLNQIHEQRKQSDQQLIDSVNAAIDRTTAASTKPYQAQIEQLPEAYQKQFDANAVQELVGRRKVEEAMANMGLTDSGLNRTQQTALSVQRGNADAAARLEQQKKTQELQDKIAQLIEAGAAQKQQQAAGVLSNTANWFNDALAGSYNTAMQQGTSMYNADLAREEQARQAELDRQNALAVADKQKEAAQEKAKQQEFENKMAMVSALQKMELEPDSVIAYMKRIGLLPSDGEDKKYPMQHMMAFSDNLRGRLTSGKLNDYSTINEIVKKYPDSLEAQAKVAEMAGVLDAYMEYLARG